MFTPFLGWDALAVHDIEQALMETPLRLHMQRGVSVSGRH